MALEDHERKQMNVKSLETLPVWKTENYLYKSSANINNQLVNPVLNSHKHCLELIRGFILRYLSFFSNSNLGRKSSLTIMY